MPEAETTAALNSALYAARQDAAGRVVFEYRNDAGLSVTKDASSVTLNILLADLGLAVGDTFLFDAITTGGGGSDGAVDSAGNPAPQITEWNQDSDAHNLTYHVVPEPATMITLGLGAAALLRKRRRN